MPRPTLPYYVPSRNTWRTSYQGAWIEAVSSGDSVPPRLDDIVTVNPNGDPCDAYYNAFLAGPAVR